MDYRKEIDGLRAVAVLPVMFFHAGFQTFRGGFVGVDIFFVISGYLITSMILSEQQHGTFSLVAFYERRARRILPALFIVMLAVWPFAWLWLFPSDMKSFSQSLVAVAVFASNLLFWRTTNYFDDTSELKPMLHTWSLSVEEQYYLLFPLLLISAARFGKRTVIGLVIVLGAVSLAVAQWGSVHEPIPTFYLLPGRAWELMVGALAACYCRHKASSPPRKIVSEASSLVGLGLIAYSVFAFDKQLPFPSFYTLIPAVGAALVVLYANATNSVGKLLGNRVLVGVGLISYSAYLWHQPLFALARARVPDEPSKLMLAGLTVVALLFAICSWKWVEGPCRRKTFSRKLVFLCSAAGSIFFALIGLAGYFCNGFESRLSPMQRDVIAFRSYAYKRIYMEGDCLLRPEQTYQEFRNGCSPAKAKHLWMIWGDSHAAALSFGLRNEQRSIIQYTASACPPIKNLELRTRPNCKFVNDFVLSKIQQLHPERVLLHADWLLYQDLDLTPKLHNTIRAIQKISPSSKVTVIGSVPQWAPNLPAYMARRRIGLDTERYLRNPALDELRPFEETLHALARRDNVDFLSPLELMCQSVECQATTEYNGRIVPTAWDYGHLTEGGSALLAKKIVAQLEYAGASANRNYQ